jgi:hypothetical protein
MPIRHPKDFLTGILFILFGAAAMTFATEYPIGSAAKMGPGYFPFVLGGVLGVLGLVILARSLLWATGAHGWPTLRLLPVTLVLSSVVLFGLLLRPLGLVGATLVLVLICSRASSEFRWKEAVLNAGALALIVWVVFVFFLEFPVPVWPAWLARTFQDIFSARPA